MTYRPRMVRENEAYAGCRKMRLMDVFLMFHHSRNRKMKTLTCPTSVRLLENIKKIFPLLLNIEMILVKKNKRIACI